MMAAVLAHGTTILRNCAMEPEIGNVAEWLNACGADISGIGSPTLTIRGRGGKLLSPKQSFVTIPDRVTAGSFLILGALTAKELTIENCRPDHMEAVTQLLIDLGVRMEIGADKITVYGAEVTKPYAAISSLRTHEYPGFPTDLQSPIVTLLTQSAGESIIFETIFEGRFKYVEDLTAMGATITTMNPREILIKGPTVLRQLADDEQVTAHDIRAGFAVVLAALIGTGTFTVSNIHLIDRGYERLEEVLTGLGADVKRVSY
jgi:UDP-N-acetylglucosamine 1-carboxyvinyltransferase